MEKSGQLCAGLERGLFLQDSGSPEQKHQVTLSTGQGFGLKSSDVQKETEEQGPPGDR